MPQHEPPPDRIQVHLPGRAVEVGDQRVDRRVGLLQDRRDPAVEAPAAEGGLHRRAPSLPVRTVGHDHRRRTGHEADHVERVPPPERRRRHGQQLVDDRRVTEHDHPERPGTEREHRAQLGRQLVEHRLGLDEQLAHQTRLATEGRARQRAIPRLLRIDRGGHAMSSRPGPDHWSTSARPSALPASTTPVPRQPARPAADTQARDLPDRWRRRPSVWSRRDDRVRRGGRISRWSGRACARGARWRRWSPRPGCR